MTPAKKDRWARFVERPAVCAAKITYTTKARALTAVAAHARHGVTRYVYKCPACKQWHLTSKPQKKAS